MKDGLLPRLIRFGFALVCAWLFLRLVAALIPGPAVDLSTSAFQRRPVDLIIAQQWPATLSWLAQALAYGLLPGLALGLFSGKPGSVPDRLLGGLVLLLTAMPSFIPPIVGIILALGRGQASLPGAALGGLSVVAGAWVARAVREAGLTARSQGGVLDRRQALLSGFGRVLQQFGNLLAAVLLAEIVAGRPGLGKLLIDGLYARDYAVVLGVTPLLIFTTLIFHLAGDLAVSATEREALPASRPCPGWLSAGALLTALLFVAAVATFGGRPDAVNLAQKLFPPGGGHLLGTDAFGRDLLQRIAAGTRTSLSIAFVATLIASVLGTVVGVLGGFTGRMGAILFAPRLTVPNLLWPLAILLPALMIVRPSIPVLMLLVGLISYPLVAYPVRRLIQSLRDSRPASGAVFGLLGGLVLVMAGALLAEATLGFLGFGVMPPTASLGNVMTGGRQFLRQAPHAFFYPGSVAALGAGGLFLLGHALTEAAGHQAGE